jgi:hypothetical protein
MVGTGMFTWMRKEWRAVRDAEPGQRFEKHYRRTHDVPGARKYAVLYWLAAVVTFAIGVVLVFIPGPAILFFLITAALVATQALWLARKLDRAEVKLRAWGRGFKEWWQRRALLQKIALSAGAGLIALSAVAAGLFLFLR